MQIHYFQRYHSKENVATANTMLLLSRLYSYSTEKFYRFLKEEYFLEGFEPEIVFDLQEKTKKSVLDAAITQESFKIAVEAKTSDWFHVDQLENHLSGFNDEKSKVLITIAPNLMAKEKYDEFSKILDKYNKDKEYPIKHVNTTFLELAEAVSGVLEDRDYEMQDILNDYLAFCYNDGLIYGHDSWKYLRVKVASSTFDFNIKNNVYYDSANHGFRPHDYLGLYVDKSIRAIGKITDIITICTNEEGNIEYSTEQGKCTVDIKNRINDAIIDSKLYGYDLTQPHRFFFVEKFYELDYKKETSGPLWNSRVFDLECIMGLRKDDNRDAKDIAKFLDGKIWT